MQWQDEGFVTRAIIFQEQSLRLFIFTKDHGLCTGIQRYAKNKATRQQFQRGNLLRVTWQARLEDHLGEWRTELIKPFGGYALSFSQKKLLAFESALALLSSLLPERMPMENLYDDSLQFLTTLVFDDNGDSDGYLSAYCRFEYQLLAHVGYGFNINRGDEVLLLNHSRGDKLSSAKARGEPFLPVPPFLLDLHAPITASCHLQALALSGYFLERIFISLKKSELPAPRQQLTASLASSSRKVSV